MPSHINETSKYCSAEIWLHQLLPGSKPRKFPGPKGSLLKGGWENSWFSHGSEALFVHLAFGKSSMDLRFRHRPTQTSRTQVVKPPIHSTASSGDVCGCGSPSPFRSAQPTSDPSDPAQNPGGGQGSLEASLSLGRLVCHKGLVVRGVWYVPLSCPPTLGQVLSLLRFLLLIAGGVAKKSIINSAATKLIAKYHTCRHKAQSFRRSTWEAWQKASLAGLAVAQTVGKGGQAGRLHIPSL